MTVSPLAAYATLADLEAMSVWWLTMLSSAVSTNCASKMGARTVMMGSSGKTTVPSGTAYRSPVKRKVRRYSKNSSSNRPSERR